VPHRAVSIDVPELHAYGGFLIAKSLVGDAHFLVTSKAGSSFATFLHIASHRKNTRWKPLRDLLVRGDPKFLAPLKVQAEALPWIVGGSATPPVLTMGT